ncbi:probable tubulin polyglutamylase ttll-15 isoform X1 [Hydra vulgaris]|uniref:Probable tubulin polyglutamylase ttll-15 isoform X1 n=2 Tax=Hydra vulgaris TaxID=6087 RepID=A0ABM4BX96_HYDVU
MYKIIESFSDYSHFKKPTVNAHCGYAFPKYLSLIMTFCIFFFLGYNFYQYYSVLIWKGTLLFQACNKNSPVVWVYAEKTTHLQHVINIFEQTGYVAIAGITPPKKWDVMWSYTFPFLNNFNDLLQKLQPHQKVNHMPGIGYLTLKVYLASLKKQWIPEAFVLPEDKDQFDLRVQKFPNKSWVQKSNNHRGIKIIQAKDVDFQSTNSFIQEFVDQPLLVDGKKFDIGVYVVITSVEPLLAYAYSSEILVRFCKHNYYPFNPEDTESYVVGDDYLPVSEMPSLKSYYNQFKMTVHDSLFTYLYSIGYNSQKIWYEIKRCIAEVLIEKQVTMQKSFTGFLHKQNFFELVRMDFIIDQLANVWLMEINMSPNLSSEVHKLNALMYEQVIYNTLSLVGVASHLKSQFSELDVASSDRDIMFATDQCASEECHSMCLNKCRLCHHCLSEDMRMFLKKAFREHNNKGGFARVWPTVLNASMVQNEFQLSESNQILFQWFKEKCARNDYWCF